MRYIIAALSFLGLAILAIVILIHVLTKHTSTTQPVSLSAQYQTGISVKFLTDGTINNDQLHRSISITENINNINMTVYKGYEGQVLNSYNYPNNPTAFKNFLASLGFLGYTLKINSPYKSSLGLCPNYYRFNYYITGSPNGLNQDLWSTTCGPGTMGGHIGAIQQDFQNQIPNYYGLTNGINLSLTSPPTASN